jgi:hypothetical protein
LLSRFFNVSFFSRCSRWIGAGVRDGARDVDVGFNGEGTLTAPARFDDVGSAIGLLEVKCREAWDF